jgi:hypothetical protein
MIKPHFLTDTEILDHLQEVINKRVSTIAYDIDLGGLVLTIRPGRQNDIRQLFRDQPLNHFGRLVAESPEK